MKSKLLILMLLAVLAVALVSCNIGGSGNDTTTAPSTTAAPGTTAAPATTVRTEPVKPVTTAPVTTVDDGWSNLIPKQ